MTEIIYVFEQPQDLEDAINKRLAQYDAYKIKYISSSSVVNDVDDIYISVIMVVDVK